MDRRKHKRRNSNDNESDSEEHCNKTVNCCQINKCLKKYPSLPGCPSSDKTKVMVCADDKIFWVPRDCIVDPDCEHTYKCLCDIEKGECPATVDDPFHPLVGQLSLVKDRDGRLKWIESRCLTECVNAGQLQCCLDLLPELGESTCTICWNLKTFFEDHMMYPKPWKITAIYLNGEDYLEGKMYDVPFNTIEELEQILIVNGWYNTEPFTYCISVQGTSVECGLSRVSVMSGTLERATKCDQKPKRTDCCNPDRVNRNLDVFCQELECECVLNECADLQLIYRTGDKSYALGSLDKIWECACIETCCKTTCEDNPHVSILPHSTLGDNVSLSIGPRGTGFLSAQKPDGTEAGGNCRGLHAVDWQTDRQNADEVAKGDYSIIVGGLSNKVDLSSGFSSIVGGEGCKIQNSNKSFIGNGIGNEINVLETSVSESNFIGSGTFNIITVTTKETTGVSSIVGGSDNRVSDATKAFIGGGSENKILAIEDGATADYASIVGGLNNEITTDGNENSTVAGAFIGGGSGNKIKPVTIYKNASNAIVVGGIRNESQGPSSVVVGGADNVSSSANSFIGAGVLNKASNFESVVAGGNANESSGPWSGILGGRDAVASQYGQQAHASGLFALKGDAQTGQYVLRNITMNSSDPTSLFLDGVGGTLKMVIPDNSTWTFNILVTARGRSGPIWAGYEIAGVIENNNGTVGVPTTTIIFTGESDAGLNAIAVDDDANNALDIKVTGLADETIQWVAFVRTVETFYERLVEII